MLPVILSGGSGTRLWPLSTPEVPKQFLPIMDTEKTLIQQTVERMNGLDFVSAPLVICNEKHLPLVKTQLKKIDKLHRPVMLEPIGRNTAPAITAAALYCKENEPDGLMCVLASDHAIMNVAAFQTAVKKARDAALGNKYALFGIVPDRPETGYGYIETDMADSHAESFAVKSFKEKPDAATAQQYLAAKNYFWNSGMFVIPAVLLLDEMAKVNPDMLAKVKASYATAEKNAECIRLNRESFESIEGNSIDYVIMEHTKNAVVVPLNAGWSDVGSWDMVWALSEKDENKNVMNSGTFCKDASGNYIYTTSGRPVALLGVKNCIVIESESGLLIADKRYVQDVKKAAENFLKKENKK
jgi:mannose-1-phosphate guanylyltransferase/mannose-1-phosphate guanylyltransferase/mannose-6-phosphate isomerase